MKFAVATVVAVCATSVQGFSITMSSYLDNLGGPGGLSSGGGSAPTPSSYFPTPYAPAPSPVVPSTPAPAPYQSSFADAPANNGLNYMGSLGGGGQMKSGSNYSGVSSKFSPAQSVGNSVYLDNLKDAAAAPPSYATSSAPAPYSPAPASYQSSPAPASYQSSPAPAPASTGNYLENLAGSAGAISSSYNSMRNSFAVASSTPAPAPTGGYLGSL